MSCPNCGGENPADAHFCGSCGTALPAAAAPAEPSGPTGPTGPPAAPMQPPAPIPPVPPTAPPTAPIPPVPPMPPPPGSTDPTFVGGMPPMPPGPPDATTTFAAPPPAGPPPVSPTRKKSRKSLLLGLIALLLVGAAVGSFLVFGGDDDDEVSSGAVSIVLEPIGQTLRDDFAGNLDLRNFDSSIENVLPDVPPLGRGIASALSARQVDGDTPGLFGGSRDQGTCDVDQLVDFLTDSENEDKASAWAETLGVEVDDIEDFIRTLTPVRVRFDTRVTNHGFVDGDANAFQSVLEAGTAVLVDDEGVPRVKCNCGNPLTEPADIGDLDEDDALDADALVQNLDAAWEAFDPDLIVVVEPGETLEEFVLVDIDTGELFVRPVGTDGGADGDVDPDEVCDLLGDSPTCSEEPPDDTTTTTSEPEGTTTTVVLGTGDVQVTLQWQSNADLDLAVTDPTGEVIDFSNRGPSATGGQLDVDSNIGCPPDADSGVENVFWPPGGAPAGDYTVTVTGFSVDGCGGGDYVLTIKVAGAEDQVIRDSVSEDEADTFDFTVA